MSELFTLRYQKEELLPLEELEKAIESYPDFPKKGVVFRDIFPLLRNHSYFFSLIYHMESKIKDIIGENKLDVIVGLEARGFLFTPLAIELQCSFVPVRKSGKLAGKCTEFIYEKEYGKDAFEIQSDSLNADPTVLLVDDLLATGGSLFAAQALVRKIAPRAKVLGAFVVIEIDQLNGRKLLEKENISVHTLYHS